jgi:aminoglycoside phosphotransferase (APT) family kinase protein
MSSQAELAGKLRAWLAAEVGDPGAAITGLKRTSAGFSRENWVFELTWNDHGVRRTVPLIARRDPPGSVLQTDRKVETAVLRALEPTSVPAPRLRWADIEGAHLGRPALVMDLVDGVCDGFVLSSSRPVSERLAIAHLLYDRLAEIHLVDWRALGLGGVLEDPGTAAADAVLAHWESELRRVQLEPEPELELVIDWLRRHAPRNEVTTLVHGDFKAGNVLMRDGDGADAGSTAIAAVLDWETVHLGDPHEDLGWVTNPLRFREHTIPEVWQPRDLLARWSERTGMTVQAETVRWYAILANLKLSVIVLTGTQAFTSGRLDRIHQSPVGIYRLMLDQMEA